MSMYVFHVGMIDCFPLLCLFRYVLMLWWCLLRKFVINLIIVCWMFV